MHWACCWVVLLRRLQCHKRLLQRLLAPASACQPSPVRMAAATATYNDGFTEAPHKHHAPHHNNNYNNNQFSDINTAQQYNNNQQYSRAQHSTARYEPDAALIAQAEQLRNQSRALSQQSQQAYSSGNGSEAHNLSQQSKELKSQAEQIEFRAHNVNRPMTEIDLHMLYVEEAMQELTKRIEQCQQQSISPLTVIVGRGIHSTDHILKLGPAAEQLFQQRGIQYQRDQPTLGCLLANIPTSSNTQQYQAQSAQPVYNNGHANNQSQQYSQQQQQYNQAAMQQQEPDPVQQCLSLLNKCTIM